MLAKRSRGNNRVIQHHAQGARSITGLDQQHRMPPQPSHSSLDRKIIDDLTRPANCAGGTTQATGVASGVLTDGGITDVRINNASPAGPESHAPEISLSSPSAMKCYRPVAAVTNPPPALRTTADVPRRSACSDHPIPICWAAACEPNGLPRRGNLEGTNPITTGDGWMAPAVYPRTSRGTQRHPASTDDGHEPR
jgi:hypothetical protein